MTTVLISGWNVGFEKVQFTLLPRNVIGLSLTKAKEITDAVLRNEAVELQVGLGEAEPLLAAMSRLGARCAVSVSAL